MICPLATYPVVFLCSSFIVFYAPTKSDLCISLSSCRFSLPCICELVPSARRVSCMTFSRESSLIFTVLTKPSRVMSPFFILRSNLLFGAYGYMVCHCLESPLSNQIVISLRTDMTFSRTMIFTWSREGIQELIDERPNHFTCFNNWH